MTSRSEAAAMARAREATIELKRIRRQLADGERLPTLRTPAYADRTAPRDEEEGR